MINNNPRSYDAPDEWIECPKCRNVMVRLDDFEISEAAEGPTIGASLLEFLIFGWITFVVNYAMEFFSFGGRKSKLAKLKAELLPAFPRTLVCPRCLHVKERS